MKEYTLNIAEGMRHQPEQPERTARQVTDWGFRYKVWSNRRALAKTIRLQQKRTIHRLDWRPVVPLADGEGY